MARNADEKQFIVARSNGRSIEYVGEANKFTLAVSLMKKDLIKKAEFLGVSIIEQDLTSRYKDIGAGTDRAWLNISNENIIWQILKVR